MSMNASFSAASDNATQMSMNTSFPATSDNATQMLMNASFSTTSDSVTQMPMNTSFSTTSDSVTQMSTNISFSAASDNISNPLPLLDCGLPLGECDILRHLKTVMLSLSLIVNVAIVVCVVILQKWKTFRERLFVNMMLASLSSTLAGLGNYGNPEAEGTPGCIAQAFFNQMLDMVVFLWIVTLTIYLYQLLVNEKDTDSWEWLYTVLCWVLPLSIACLPLSTNDYGLAAAPYCWIKGTSSGDVWRIAIYYIPVFGGNLIIMLVFFYMFWHAAKANTLYQGMNDPTAVRHREVVKDYLKPLTAYAVTFTFLNFFRFVNRMYQINNPPQLGLVFVHVLCGHAYGIVLSTLFVITHGPREFAPSKFRSGLEHYKTRWTEGPKPNPIDQYHVEPAVPEPSPQPNRRYGEALNCSNNAHNNSTCTSGDITSFDIHCPDIISLDNYEP